MTPSRRPARSRAAAATGQSALAVITIVTALVMAALLIATGNARAEDTAASGETYSKDEVLQAVEGFFGDVSEDMARAVDKVFADQGRPNAYIVGEEGAGAIGVGLRYGSGTLNMKPGRVKKVYWQGPSIGWDIGGNASKVFTLVYNLPNVDSIYRRFPGVEGSLYVIGGVGVNYQQAGDTILAPMRAGAGLRAGANVGYLSYTRERKILPF